jgi:hypothetical protein
VTSTFVDLGDGRTQVRIHQAGVPPALLSPEAQAGFGTSLDRFAAHLQVLARDGAEVTRHDAGHGH